MTRNEEFEQLLSKLTRIDNTIWRPLRNLKTPKIPTPSIRNKVNKPWAKSDAE